MNKKILLLGAAAVAGYFTLTGFGPKQDAQKAEIAQMVTTKLNDLRAQKDQECTDRVTADAQRRYDEMAAAEEAAAVAAGSKKMVKKGSKGPKVDPLPQPSPTKDPQKTRGGAVQENSPEQQKARPGAIPESAPQTPAQQKKRGGAAKEGGGGGN